MDVFDGYDSYDEQTTGTYDHSVTYQDSCTSSESDENETTLLTRARGYSIDSNDSVIKSNKIKDQLLVISKKDREISNKHRNIELATIDSMQYVTFLGIFSLFGYTLRSNIIVLYMRSLLTVDGSSNNMILISIILYVGCILSGINSILFTRFGNYWRFDSLIVISIFLDIILYSIEAASWNFTMLAIAYILAGQPIQSLSNQYVNKMLPSNQSQKQISTFYKLGVLSYVLGPAIAGILSYFFDYRLVFWSTVGISLISWFYCLIFINNQQIKLQSLILGFKRYYEDYPSIDSSGLNYTINSTQYNDYNTMNTHTNSINNNNNNSNNRRNNRDSMPHGHTIRIGTTSTPDAYIQIHNNNNNNNNNNHNSKNNNSGYTEIQNEFIPSIEEECNTSALIPIDCDFTRHGSENEPLPNDQDDGTTLSDNENGIINEGDDAEEEARQRTEIYKIGELSDDLKWLVLNDYRFPLCMSNNEMLLLSQNTNMRVTRRQWFIIIIMLIQNSIHIGIEAAYIIWYTVYMKDKYNCSIIVSTTQLTVLCFFAICGMTCMTNLGEKFKQFGKTNENENSENSNNNNNNNVEYAAIEGPTETTALNNNNNSNNKSGTNMTNTANTAIANNNNNNNNNNNMTQDMEMYDRVLEEHTRDFNDRKFMHVRRRYDMCNAFVVILIVGYIIIITLTVLIIPFNILNEAFLNLDTLNEDNDNNIEASNDDNNNEFNDDTYMYTFWIYVSLLGFIWGIIGMAQEFIMVDIEMKHKFYRITKSPKINNIRETIKFMVRGCVVFVIGLLWDKSYEWLWFAQGISFTICFSLLAVLIVEEVK